MLPFLLLLIIPFTTFAIEKETALAIGEQIWKNECGKSKEKLTHWNVGEEFPSLGIGHFIWYTAGKRQRFDETFPALVAYMSSQNVKIPNWLRSEAPWSNREQFYAEFDSPRMKALRELLYETRGMQVDFMVARMEKGLLQISEKGDQKRLALLFEHLKATPNGLYALIDYTNFKGLGVSETERYKGQGWGLLQVLLAIPSYSKDTVNDFVTSAKNLLAQRISNSPPERNEAKWLPGWNNRLDSYLLFQTK